MSAVQKGKARAYVDQQEDPAGGSGSGRQDGRSKTNAKSNRVGKAKKVDQAVAVSQAGPSSSSVRRKQEFSPQPSNSEDEDDDQSDLELEHESEDEFEQYRSGAAPSYAQYMGDSDLEDDDGDSEDEEMGEPQSNDDGDSMQGDADHPDSYMSSAQAGTPIHRSGSSDTEADLTHRPAANPTRNTHQSTKEA